MSELEPVDRLAAYVAAAGALDAIRRATASWPDALADQARSAAITTVVTTAQSLQHDHATPGRRRCVRAALATAIELAETCDVAKALGIEGLDEAQRRTGKAIAMLGLLFHANASPVAEEESAVSETPR
jgi:hypothetical protein